jgi:hypothetical protein
MTSINEVYAIVNAVMTERKYEYAGKNLYRSIIHIDEELGISIFKSIHIDFYPYEVNITGFINGPHDENGVTIFRESGYAKTICADIVQNENSQKILYEFVDAENTLVDLINQLETYAFEASGNRFPELFSNTSCEPSLLM